MGAKCVYHSSIRVLARSCRILFVPTTWIARINPFVLGQASGSAATHQNYLVITERPSVDLALTLALYIVLDRLHTITSREEIGDLDDDVENTTQALGGPM
jgi:hypothetical protein